MRTWPLRILIVEDDLAARKELGAILAFVGYTVEEATDGEDAARKLEAGQFHVVITDCRLPCMEGLDLLEAIRRRWPHLPVIVISAEWKGSGELALQRGASGWLRKPCTASELIQIVCNAAKATVSDVKG